MLRSLKELISYTIQAKDGEIGKVSNFYFDDDMWTVRYLVADTGNWLIDRKVLISRLVLGQPDWEAHLFPVGLTKAQVESSPDIDLAQPVSRQQEVALSEHYQWPLYWSVPGGVYHLGIPPATVAEAILANGQKTEQEQTAVQEEQNDPHLRSAWEMFGYHIQARDGEIGRVEDFIVDDEVWVIRYMVADTENSKSAKNVLVDPQWIKEMNWSQAQVQIDLTQETIKNRQASIST